MIRKVEDPTKASSGKDQGRQDVFRDHNDSEEAWFMNRMYGGDEGQAFILLDLCKTCLFFFT